MGSGVVTFWKFKYPGSFFFNESTPSLQLEMFVNVPVVVSLFSLKSYFWTQHGN